MVDQPPLATNCSVDPDSSNGAAAFACGWGCEAALCLEQKTTDYELIIADRRGAKHCGPGSIFRVVREKDAQKERCGRQREDSGGREGGENEEKYGRREGENKYK